MNIELQSGSQSSDPVFDFVVHHGDASIPATFWKGPASRGPRTPLTLLQHGGPFHARHDRSRATARAIVDRTGGAVLLIDGPIHGRRRRDELGVEAMLGAFERHWRQAPGIEVFVADWRIALDAVCQEGWADPERIAWFGMSMGTAYGLALCAAERRIKAAALGMWGTDWGHEAELLEAAQRVRTPVLFQIKAGDEIFSTSGQRALFDALGSANKCLHTFEGGHSLTAPGQIDELLDFIARALADDPVEDAPASTAKTVAA